MTRGVLGDRQEPSPTRALPVSLGLWYPADAIVHAGAPPSSQGGPARERPRVIGRVRFFFFEPLLPPPPTHPPAPSTCTGPLTVDVCDLRQFYFPFLHPRL